MTLPLDKLDLNTLPVWVITIVIVLFLAPRTMEKLGIFIPPLGEWIETRQAVVHHRLNTKAAEQAHEVLIDTRLLNLLEQSLQQSWTAQEKLESRMSQLVRAVDRNNDLLTVLNMTMARFADEIRDRVKIGHDN